MIRELKRWNHSLLWSLRSMSILGFPRYPKFVVKRFGGKKKEILNLNLPLYRLLFTYFLLHWPRRRCDSVQAIAV